VRALRWHRRGRLAPADRLPWRNRISRVLRFWASPPDQPVWTRPVLLAIAALSGGAYSVGAARASIEPYYGAAARSMSQSWRDFVYGAFDPFGTVTVDKLPGALWPQALSLRVFGFHIWAFVLPQVVEGVITVLVLYRAVRLLAGPAVGLIAALVLASSPLFTGRRVRSTLPRYGLGWPSRPR
jgi:4-amino-4-deoxy-L-arabinose transferase-like glycosyltransferase